ncbi:MAG: MATE family efflux transporter [Planctomycetota bacterium]|nr:MATE family efflux transporter [Planctomycetota bacterium]
MSRPHDSIEVQDTAIAEPAPATAAVDETLIRSGKLAGMSMWGAIWVLSWPVLLESLLSSLMGVVDSTLSAGISADAADAVGGAAYFMWFVALVSIGLGVGATAMISRSMGRGRLGIASAVVGQCTTLGLVLGVLVAGITAVMAPTVATWLGLGPGAHRLAVVYIYLCAAGVPLQTFVQVGISCCRGAGDSFRPLMAMLAINIINLVLSFLLSGVDLAVAAKGPDGSTVRRVLLENPVSWDMGVAGVALGTSIAWAIGAVVMLWMLIGGVHGVRLRARRLRPHWHTVRRLLRVGLPNVAETFGMWLGNFLVILMVGLMREPGMLGANVITVRIEAFSFLPGFAMSLAAATLVGTYLGAGSVELARRAVLRCLWIACGLMATCGLSFVLFGRQIAGLFTQQAVHLERVPVCLAVAGLAQPVFAVSIVFRSALRGAGDTSSVAWITWISIFGLRLPMAWLFSGVDLPLPGGGLLSNPSPMQAMGVHPLTGLWIGLCLELCIRSLLFTAAFMRGNWAHKKV